MDREAISAGRVAAPMNQKAVSRPKVSAKYPEIMVEIEPRPKVQKNITPKAAPTRSLGETTPIRAVIAG